MKLDRLEQILERAASRRITVIGDLMLDEFVWGKVGRISPEAPVPVVEVTGESFYPVQIHKDVTFAVCRLKSAPGWRFGRVNEIDAGMGCVR